VIFVKKTILFFLITILYSDNPIDFYLTGDNIHTIIGTIEDGVEKPRDLDFHPTINNQLWILNQGEDVYPNNSELITNVCVPLNRNITFVIFDSADDGICCESGEGSYTVSDCNNIYATGGDYESSESTSFTVENNCNNACDLDESSLTILINTDDWAKEISWKLIDSDDGTIYSKKLEPGGSTVTYFDAGFPYQSSEYRKDSYSRHFMHTASAISFDNDGFFANTLECKDANNNPNGFFSGPTLWDSDLSIYANLNQDGPLLGSHLDMIHQSPYSMGIEYAGIGNVYWVFDGYHSSIVRYDFATPHEIGGHDHSDGKVWRHDEVEIAMHEGVPSHMVLDENTGNLYISDTGNQRILLFNTQSGVFQQELTPYGESLDQYWLMQNSEWEVYINQGLIKPSGIDFYENRLIVSDYSSGDIILFDTSSYPPEELGRIITGFENSIMGIKIGPGKKIWYVNHSSNEVVRIDYDTLLGDVNQDGQLNILDVVILVSFVLENHDINPQQFIVADLNFDGLINVLDVVNLVDTITN
tara:strand:- start:58 stop:1647 length:1590 start_codon:yes stop_codon:yes gene_type:complete